MDAKIGSIDYSQVPILSGEHHIVVTAQITGGPYEPGTILVDTGSGIEGLAAGMLPTGTEIFGIVLESTDDSAAVCVHGTVLASCLKYAEGTVLVLDDINAWKNNLRHAGIYLV